MSAEELGLENEWVIWFNRMPRKGGAQVEYKESIKEVGSVHTVQAFWAFMNHLSPSDLPCFSNLQLFKKGIRPSWEDPANESGGRFLVNCEKANTKEWWTLLSLAAIGESLSSREELCGVEVSFRGRGDSLRVWNRSTDPDACALLQHELESLFGVDSDQVNYRPHGGETLTATLVGTPVQPPPVSRIDPKGGIKPPPGLGLTPRTSQVEKGDAWGSLTVSDASAGEEAVEPRPRSPEIDPELLQKAKSVGLEALPPFSEYVAQVLSCQHIPSPGRDGELEDVVKTASEFMVWSELVEEAIPYSKWTDMVDNIPAWIRTPRSSDQEAPLVPPCSPGHKRSASAGNRGKREGRQSFEEVKPLRQKNSSPRSSPRRNRKGSPHLSRNRTKPARRRALGVSSPSRRPSSLQRPTSPGSSMKSSAIASPRQPLRHHSATSVLLRPAGANPWKSATTAKPEESRPPLPSTDTDTLGSASTALEESGSLLGEPAHPSICSTDEAEEAAGDTLESNEEEDDLMRERAAPRRPALPLVLKTGNPKQQILLRPSTEDQALSQSRSPEGVVPPAPEEDDLPKAHPPPKAHRPPKNTAGEFAVVTSPSPRSSKRSRRRRGSKLSDAAASNLASASASDLAVAELPSSRAEVGDDEANSDVGGSEPPNAKFHTKDETVLDAAASVVPQLPPPASAPSKPAGAKRRRKRRGKSSTKPSAAAAAAAAAATKAEETAGKNEPSTKSGPSKSKKKQSNGSSQVQSALGKTVSQQAMSAPSNYLWIGLLLGVCACIILTCLYAFGIVPDEAVEHGKRMLFGG